MDKVGGNRNYGYGKQLAWAGKNALADYYGEGTLVPALLMQSAGTSLPVS